MRHFTLLGGLAGFLMAGQAWAGVQITFNQVFNFEEDAYEYEIGITNTPPSSYTIVAFGVDNPTTWEAYTDRSGWSAQIISAAQWDAGIDVGYSIPDDPGFVLYFNTADLPTFAELWGPEAGQINFYHHSVYYGNPIGPNEFADNQFFFKAGALASKLVALDATGAVIPEPASLSILALAGLTIMGRRRR